MPAESVQLHKCGRVEKSVCTTSALGIAGGGMTKLPIPAAAAAVRKVRRETLPVVLTLASSDIGHSAVKNVSLESRTVQSVSSAGVQVSHRGGGKGTTCGLFARG